MKNFLYQLIGIIILIVLLFSFFISKKKEIPNVEIYEAENPNKSTFLNITKKSTPTIFTKTTEPFFNIQEYTLQDIEELPEKDKKQLHENIQEHLSYYKDETQKSTTKTQGEIQMISTPLQKVTNDTYLITIFKGVKKILLFTPNQTNLLYPSKSNKNKSDVNFFVDGFEKYPLLAQTKFVEIELYPGHMLYIPKGWWWTGMPMENCLLSYTKIDNSFFNLKL